MEEGTSEKVCVKKSPRALHANTDKESTVRRRGVPTVTLSACARTPSRELRIMQRVDNVRC